MNLRQWLGSWPVIRQLQQGDSLGLGKAAQSPRSAALEPRTVTADRMARSVCPYCAVGCGQRVFVKDEQVIQIEGDPDSPVSRGRLCPKGAASKQLVTGPNRETKVKYRRPHGTEWEELDLETAMDMIADRVIATREATWQTMERRLGELGGLQGRVPVGPRPRVHRGAAAGPDGRSGRASNSSSKA